MAEVRVNHRARSPVVIRRRDSSVLFVEEIKLASSKEREGLVLQLPEDCRSEALALLTDLAAEVPSQAPKPAERDLQGRAIVFKDPEPWPEEVDGDRLLDDLYRTFIRFLALPEGGAAVLALWAIHAHTYDTADVSPLLALVSPERRCGKTKTLQLLESLVPRPLMASNISPAAVFRTVEKFRPTLLVDEADTFMRMHEELQGILNSGHSRRSAVVIRTVGDDHEPRGFGTWAPKVVALIGTLPPTLEDRAIKVAMRRRSKAERIEPLRMDRVIELDPLRSQAARWARDNTEALCGADPEVPADLNDRAADNWRPLLAIADLAGGEWPERARHAALLLSGRGEEDETIRVQLLADIRGVFEDKGADKLSSKDLVWGLIALEGRPWGEWRGAKAMSPNQLARMLKPFDIRPYTLRIGDETPRGYRLEDFQDTFLRYLPPDPQQTQQCEEGAPERALRNRNGSPDVSVEEEPEGPRGDSIVADVSTPEEESRPPGSVEP